MSTSDPKYEAAIKKGLDAAFKRAGKEERRFDPAAQRVAIFSDHHKGVGDQADDFRRCEHAYTSALGYYLEAGYQLFILGDAEELWEERAGPVLERYGDVLELEGEFARRGGVERFWGNHDDHWASNKQVDKHLRPIFGELTVREGLRLKVARAGKPAVTLFFVHGHQGTSESDRFGWVSRLFVRYVWRPLQRKTGFSATTPARSFELRAKHDDAMYKWAGKQHGLVLFAGHTHRPVFARCVPDPPPTRKIGELEPAVDQARAGGDTAAAAALRAELEYKRTSDRRPDVAVRIAPPCYFNTGCCSFPDGDITGLEIADGEVRLVRWPGNIRELSPKGPGVDAARRILVTEQLENVFSAVTGETPAAPSIEEVEIR